MEIVKARSALLSNYEVYKLLTDQRRQQAQKVQSDAKGKVKAKDSGDVVGATGSGGGAPTTTVPPNLAKIQDETIEYLELAPHPTLRQNAPNIAKLLEDLRTVGSTTEGGAGLTKPEKLMVVNLAPTTDVEIYTIVEELEDRLPTEIQTILDMVSNSLLPEPMQGVEATNGLAEGGDGRDDAGYGDDMFDEGAEDGYGEYEEEPQEFYSEPAYGDRPDTPPELDET
ncbi:hypothetical protein FRB95_010112 [Tulasnella sp. JGI-2019a]|nr:hypothetical protein FRB95_010112 [Tulasnella sp. JGI-2019a]